MKRLVKFSFKVFSTEKSPVTKHLKISNVKTQKVVIQTILKMSYSAALWQLDKA